MGGWVGSLHRCQESSNRTHGWVYGWLGGLIGGVKYLDFNSL